jgi:asparagine synthase (glutamine-hydrolysing)
MFLNLRLDKIEPEGFSELEGGGYIFFKGYVVRDDIIVADKDFLPTLSHDFLAGELHNRIKTYNGNFIFVILRGKEVLAGNDRYGIYPLFYTERKNQLVISTQWQRLIPFTGKELKRESVLEILSLGYVVGNKTLVENIQEFPGATMMECQVKDGGPKTIWTRYWKLEHSFKKNNLRKLEKEFAELWKKRIALYSDYIKENGNSCLQLLSGGLDSRLLAHEFDQAGIRIHGITYGLGEESGEIITAKRVMEKLAHGATHKVFYNDPQELEKIVRSEISYERITNTRNAEKELYSYQELADKASIRVPGYSGDFMAGSHIKYRMKSWKSKQDIVNYIMKFHVTPLIRSDLAKNPDHREMLIQSLSDSIPTDRDPISAFIQWDLDYRQRRYIVRSEVEANSGPTRFLLPFFDNQLIDFFLDLPMKALLNTRLYTNTQLKYLYKSNPGLIRIKRDNDRRQQVIRNNLFYEYNNKLRHLARMYRHRRNTSLHTNWSPDIDWQKESESWDLPAQVDEFQINTENISGAYVTYLLSLTKLKKELAVL